MANSFALSAAGAGTGIYTGVFAGGASNALAGMWVQINGFTKPANNVTTQVTASSTTTITTTNSGSLAETHAATALDVTTYICLDSGGLPTTVISAATGTGTQWSQPFSILDRPGGGPRTLWLTLGPTSGSFSAIAVDLQQSFNGGASWATLQSGIDIYGSPSQAVSPSPSPGATLRLSVSTFTGGTSFSLIASSN